jgi:hypothetical protein
MTKERQREEKTTPPVDRPARAPDRRPHRPAHRPRGGQHLRALAVDNTCHGSAARSPRPTTSAASASRSRSPSAPTSTASSSRSAPASAPTPAPPPSPPRPLPGPRPAPWPAPPARHRLRRAGFGHIGLLTELLADLDQLGSDTAPLRSSADNFVRMWERAAGPRSGPADPADDLDVSGVTVLPRPRPARGRVPPGVRRFLLPGALDRPAHLPLRRRVYQRRLCRRRRLRQAARHLRLIMPRILDHARPAARGPAA